MSDSQRMRVYFTGVGGQGTLTATTLLSHAAMGAGLDVVAGEVHGMAQRGGVVESVLLIGGWRSPKLDPGQADVIVGFEPLETLRALPWLRRGGTVISSSDALPPVSVALGKAAYPDMAEIARRVEEVSSRHLFLPCRELGMKAGAVQGGNTALIGAAAALGLFPFGLDAVENAVREHLPEKLRDINLAALKLGAEAAARNQ